MATPENLPFLKVRFINFFLIPVAQTYQNESVPIFCYAKCTKTAENSIIHIADLQSLTPGRVKKVTLYIYLIKNK